MRRLLRLAAVVAMCCCLVGGARAGEVPDELAKQYVPALEIIKQAYTHATITGTHVLEFPKDGGTSRTIDFVYRADGPRERLDETVVYYEQGVKTGAVAERVHLLTPEMAVWSSQEVGEKWLEFNDREREGCKGYIASTTLVDWTYLSDSLTEILRDPDGTVTALEHASRDGRPLVTIHYKWQTKSATDDEKTVSWRVDYQLSPSEGWALRESFMTSEFDGEEMSHFRLRIDYSGLSDGVPLVKRIVEEFSDGPQFDVVQRRTIDVSEIAFGSPEAHFFTRDGK